MYLAGAGDGPEAPMDVPYAFRKLRRWMPEGPTEKNRKMVEFVLNKGYLGIRLGVLPETTLLLIDLAVEWNDFAMWEAVLQTSGGGRSPHLLSSASLLRAWNVFPFSATQPMSVLSQLLPSGCIPCAHTFHVKTSLQIRQARSLPA